MKLFFIIFFYSLSVMGGEIKVKFDAKNGSDASILERVAIYRLFEPVGEIKVERDGEKEMIKASLLDSGVYSIVVWAKNQIWAPSPSFDQTVYVDQNSTAEVTVIESKNSLSLIIDLDKKISEKIESVFMSNFMVPFRLQRIEGSGAPSFGFRWIVAMRREDGKYHAETSAPDGEYILSIPYPVSQEGSPPAKQSLQTIPLALFSWPIRFERGKVILLSAPISIVLGEKIHSTSEPKKK